MRQIKLRVDRRDGRVAAFLQLGPDEGWGNNVVQATFDGATGMPAQFAASGLVAGNPAQTSVTGVVLDNSNVPIRGVTMHLLGLSQGTNGNVPIDVVPAVQTDSQGQFTLTQAPIGVFKLMADGTTAAVGTKKDPTLEFDVTTVAGRSTGVGMPIYLKDLDTVNQICVTDTTGGTLTLPDSPGFSSTVAPGSATFPGGSRSGCISATPVHMDKIPMAPGFGQQPRFILTIQPVGDDVQPSGGDDATERGWFGAAGGDRDVFLRSRPGVVRGDRHRDGEQRRNVDRIRSGSGCAQGGLALWGASGASGLRMLVRDVSTVRRRLRVCSGSVVQQPAARL